VGGLPWLSRADVRRVKPEGRKNYKIKIIYLLFIYFYLFFSPVRHRRPRGALRGRLRGKNKFNKIKFLVGDRAECRGAASA
jgi:hypothetical protein